jgi:hypothetical protein
MADALTFVAWNVHVLAVLLVVCHNNVPAAGVI